MKRVYHQCHFCGGKVSEQKVTVRSRRKPKEVLQVPVRELKVA